MRPEGDGSVATVEPRGVPFGQLVIRLPRQTAAKEARLAPPMHEPYQLPALATVTCSECRQTVTESEAQAARLSYSWDEQELYPYCPGCAEKEFGHRAKRVF
jgi:hypothetical protein